MTTDPPKVHYGARNASAAVFIDGTRFLVADDEDQQHTILRLYDANTDGHPIEAFHLDNSVLEPDSGEPEIDVEGSAWQNGRIFWIGSHSRSKNGKRRPSRHRLFATAIQNGVPVITGVPYRTLIDDVEKLLGRKIERALPPKDGGVSIEGLSARPGGGLLIGFRSPLVKNKALVVALTNPDEVVDFGAPARFDEPVLLDLGGRGIRSIEYWYERSSYMIIAGPTGTGDPKYLLMRWSGPLSTHPEILDGIILDQFPDDCAPEGLLIDGPAGTLYILLDEGNRQSEEHSFRSVAIRGLLP